MPPQRPNKEPIKNHPEGLALAVILANLCKPNAGSRHPTRLGAVRANILPVVVPQRYGDRGVLYLPPPDATSHYY
jgi:hypothetical protein